MTKYRELDFTSWNFSAYGFDRGMALSIKDDLKELSLLRCFAFVIAR
jgi:hypothetical protein